jgi:hypothetical protein
MVKETDGIRYKIGFGIFLSFINGVSMIITDAINAREYFNIPVVFMLDIIPMIATAKAQPPPVFDRYAAVKKPIANGFIE